MVSESRRDSVGSSRIFSVVSKSRRDAIKWGEGGGARNFSIIGPFYSFFLSQRGGAGPPGPPLNRPLLFTGRTASQPSISDSALSRTYYTHSAWLACTAAAFVKRSKLIAAFILTMLKQKYLASNIG